MSEVMENWRTFKTVSNHPRSGCPCKFSPRSDCFMLRVIKKTPRATSCHLLASISTLNVYVHDNKIRKRLKTYGFYGRVARKKTLFSKKNLRTNRKITGTISFALMPKTKFLANQYFAKIQILSMVVEGWWFGLVLPSQGLRNLMRQCWTPLYIRIFLRLKLGLSWPEIGSWNRTVIPSPPSNWRILMANGGRTKKQGFRMVKSKCLSPDVIFVCL